MNKHPVDLTALVGFIAGGGLAAVGGLLSVVYPGHSALFSAAGAALVAIAGAIRVAYNPTPAAGQSAVTAPKLSVLPPPFSETPTPPTKGPTP